jgi:preprotein translocase subunit SecG
MSFLIGVLTFFLIANCALLVLLVLVQLPKKDAGAGLAFGGGAADALFGAGSGNALTNITKYAAIAFFVLAVLIGALQDHSQQGNTAAFEKQMQQMKQQQQQAPMIAPPAGPTPKNSVLSMPLTTETNAPAANLPPK